MHVVRLSYFFSALNDNIRDPFIDMHRVAHHQLLFMQTENIRLLNLDNPRSFDFKTVMMEFRSVKGQNVTTTRRQSRKR